MSDRTPTTERVREEYATRMAPHLDHARAIEFDQWLTEVKAEAWNEGYISGHSRAMRRMSDEPNVEPGTNPYRKDRK